MPDENKYIFDIDSLMEKENDDRKAARKKKHKKGRVLSWVFLILFVCLFFCLGFWGFQRFTQGDRPTPSNPIKDVVESVTGNISSEPEEPEPNPMDSLLDDEDDVIVTPPEPVEVEPTEAELFDEAVRNYVASMSLEEKVAGIFFITPEALTGVGTVTRAGDGTKTAIENYPIGGLIYSSKNMTDVNQFKEVVQNTIAYSNHPLFMAVDEELGNSVFPKAMKANATMSPEAIGNNGDSSIAKTEAEKIASYMTGHGLNLNFGIVADVLTEPDNAIMKAKCFGTEASKVSEYVSKEIEAYNNYDITAAVKFFPGQGSASSDTANGLSVTARSREEMETCEFECFKAAIDAGASMVLVSHVSAPELTGDNTPCSLSKSVMTDLIRKEWGYNDVIIITDSLSKGAISSYYDSKDACVQAIKAGADMVMSPENFEESYNGVIEAVNKNVISIERINDSLARIYKVKFRGKSAEEINAMIVSE